MCRRGFGFAPALAAAGFAAVVVVLALQARTFVKTTLGWAQRDLAARTQLTARMLERPLHTQDWPSIHAIADGCRADGYHLRILASGGGVFFDAAAHAVADDYVWRTKSDEYLVTLGLRAADVLKPLYGALPVVVLALLLGVAGMAVFFAVFYRQRVRLAELTRLERFRREFIADFSHELKTPLTGILGAAEMLDGNDTLVGMIRREGQRLNALAQDVLDLARLERPGDALVRTEVDLAELATGVVARLDAKARAAGVTLALGKTGDCPRRTDRRDGDCPRRVEGGVVVSADAVRLEQALVNLIENALRHARTPDILVSVASRRKRVALIVEDHGVGVPAADRERIFERFYRVDPSRAAETGGAGLGLAIVRRIARLHGGDVRYESVTPTGSRFILEVPRT